MLQLDTLGDKRIQQSQAESLVTSSPWTRTGMFSPILSYTPQGSVSHLFPYLFTAVVLNQGTLGIAGYHSCVRTERVLLAPRGQSQQHPTMHMTTPPHRMSVSRAELEETLPGQAFSVQAM